MVIRKLKSIENEMRWREMVLPRLKPIQKIELGVYLAITITWFVYFLYISFPGNVFHLKPMMNFAGIVAISMLGGFRSEKLRQLVWEQLYQQHAVSLPNGRKDFRNEIWILIIIERLKECGVYSKEKINIITEAIKFDVGIPTYKFKYPGLSQAFFFAILSVALSKYLELEKKISLDKLNEIFWYIVLIAIMIITVIWLYEKILMNEIFQSRIARKHNVVLINLLQEISLRIEPEQVKYPTPLFKYNRLSYLKAQRNQ